jgi:hypothetical protein
MNDILIYFIIILAIIIILFMLWCILQVISDFIYDYEFNDNGMALEPMRQHSSPVNQQQHSIMIQQHISIDPPPYASNSSLPAYSPGDYV